MSIKKQNEPKALLSVNSRVSVSRPYAACSMKHAVHLIFSFWHIYDNLGHLRATFVLLNNPSLCPERQVEGAAHAQRFTSPPCGIPYIRERERVCV